MFNQNVTINFLRSGRAFLLLIIVSVVSFSSTENEALSDHSDVLTNWCVPQCPKIKVNCPELVSEGTIITCSATAKDGALNVTPTYKWRVSTGTIASGQGTSEISIDTNGLGGQAVTSTLELGGFLPQCLRTDSATTLIAPVIVNGAHSFLTVIFGEHEFKLKDEKTILDQYAIQLQSWPSDQGYIIVYGSCDGESRRLGGLIRSYLKTKGVSSQRLQAIDAGCSAKWRIELRQTNVPSSPGVNKELILPCTQCKKAKPPVRRRTDRSKKGTRNGPRAALVGMRHEMIT